MTEITLRDFLKDNTQRRAADLMKIKSQGSISKMINKHRDIRLIFDSQGTFLKWRDIREMKVPTE